MMASSMKQESRGFSHVRFKRCEEEYKKQRQNILPQTYIEALEKLLESEKEKERLKLENTQQKQQLIEYEPKVTYYDLVLKVLI